ASIIMAVAILTAALGTHPYIPYLKKPPPKRPFELKRTLAELRETLSNRAFLALFGAMVFGSMAAGLLASLNIYFNTYFWELTESQMAVLLLANFVSAALALGIAPRLSRRLGKKPAVLSLSAAGLLLGPLPIVLRL